MKWRQITWNLVRFNSFSVCGAECAVQIPGEELWLGLVNPVSPRVLLCLIPAAKALNEFTASLSLSVFSFILFISAFAYWSFFPYLLFSHFPCFFCSPLPVSPFFCQPFLFPLSFFLPYPTPTSQHMFFWVRIRAFLISQLERERQRVIESKRERTEKCSVLFMKPQSTPTPGHMRLLEGCG